MSEMWVERKGTPRRTRKFFLVCLSHDTLENYFKTNFNMHRHHKYSMSEIESMVPWEREAHVILLIQALEEEKMERERQKNDNTH